MLTDHEHQADLEAEQARAAMLDVPTASVTHEYTFTADPALPGLVSMLCDTVAKLENRVHMLEGQSRHQRPAITARREA